MTLAEQGTVTLDWPATLLSTFSEFSTPEDETLGTQIVKVCWIKGEGEIKQVSNSQVVKVCRL